MKENVKREQFNPKTTGTSSWKLRLHSVLRFPFARPSTLIISSSLIYLIVYNISIRLWKGEQHPVNRFMWRIAENNGTLPNELLRKKQAVLDYHSSRIYNARDTPPNLEY